MVMKAAALKEIHEEATDAAVTFIGDNHSSAPHNATNVLAGKDIADLLQHLTLVNGGGSAGAGLAHLQTRAGTFSQAFTTAFIITI